jgi:tetratricopeptide (TPR) repeat protein
MHRAHSQGSLLEYEKALRCYKESLKQRQEVLGLNNITVGKTLHEMALVYNMMGEHDKAAEGFRQAYRVCKLYVGFELAEETNDAKNTIINLKLLSEAISLFLSNPVEVNILSTMPKSSFVWLH